MALLADPPRHPLPIDRPRFPPRHRPLPLRQPARRRALGAFAAVWAGAALGLPRAARAADAATADLLAARLAEQGVGLAAARIEGSRIDLAVRGDAAPGVALQEGARFEIGSITKTFTALLLADAVLRRTVALDGAVEEAWPGLKLRDSAGAPIRWIDLATHRSGLPRLPTNLAPKDRSDPYADYGEAQLRRFVEGFRASVPRDTRWEYSNLGFGLLGHSLARLEKTRYDQLLASRVLGPLGLKNAACATPEARLPDLVAGHDGERRPVPNWHFDALMAAGALTMSIADLARYAQAAVGAIDSPLHEAFALAERRHAEGAAPINPIGLAWVRAPLNGRTVLNHDGATFGFTASLWLDPERGRAAAVLSNAAVGVTDLALHLLDASVPMKDFSQTRQTVVPVAAATLAAYAGVYALNDRFKLALSVKGEALWAQASGQSAFELFAKAPRVFFAKVTPLEIELDAADGSKPPAALTLRQGGQVLRFVRE